jgi:hypothetical protein
MVTREEKVLLSNDGRGRVAIVKRTDGLFCIYAHWRWPLEVQRAFNVEPIQDLRWTTDFDPTLYYDATHQIETRPRPGLYDTVEAAEKEARTLLGLNGD